MQKLERIYKEKINGFGERLRASSRGELEQSHVSINLDADFYVGGKAEMVQQQEEEGISPTFQRTDSE